MSDTIKTVDEYIGSFDNAKRERLESIRKTIKEAAPEAEEKISWQMPTYVFHGNLVHFAAQSRHIGFYPGPVAIEAFKDRIRGYKWSKGAVQFPLDKEIPHELIKDIVIFRVVENQSLAEEKARTSKHVLCQSK